MIDRSKILVNYHKICFSLELQATWYRVEENSNVKLKYYNFFHILGDDLFH